MSYRLQLLLLPLMVPAILLPVLLNRITDDAAKRPTAARRPALTEEGKDQ